MSEETEYPKTSRSTVNRLKQRATYDQETIHSIVNNAPVVHVSFQPTSISDDPFPTILPMLGCFAAYNPADAKEIEPPAVYLHGHISSRFFKLPGSSTIVADESLPGLPVCVAATHVDGMVLALTPFNHSANYRSAVVHGYASLVVDPQEKMWALERITDNILPQRWANSRVPPTEAEMKSTGVIRVDVVSASAKVRAWAAGNDQKDLEDVEMRKGVWEGVVPSWVVYGDPVPSAGNMMKKVPEYLSGWIAEKNTEGKAYATDVAVRQPQAK